MDEEAHYSGQIVTPKTLQDGQWVDDEGNPKPLWVRSKEFRETRSTISPWWGEDVKEIEVKDLDLKVPDEVMEICRTVRGLGGRPMLTGGSVVSLVMAAQHPEEFNLEPQDYDLEVFGLSEDLVKKVLEKRGEGQEMNLESGDYQLFSMKIKNGKIVEVSLPREDIQQAPGRYGIETKGVPEKKLKEAAQRRDYKINALGYDPVDKVVYDAYDGWQHLQQRRLVAVDLDNFANDPLRVYRGIQLAARYGLEIENEDPERSTLGVCRQIVQSEAMAKFSPDRIGKEFRKMFELGTYPAKGLVAAEQTGMMKRFWPEIDEAWQSGQEVISREVDTAMQVAERLGLSKHSRLVLGLAALGDRMVRQAEDKQSALKRMGNFIVRFKITRGTRPETLGLLAEEVDMSELFTVAERNGRIGNSLCKVSKRIEGVKVSMRMWYGLGLVRNRVLKGEVDEDKEDRMLRRMEEELQRVREIDKNRVKFNYRGWKELVKGAGRAEIGVIAEVVKAMQLNGEIETEQEKVLEMIPEIRSRFEEYVNEESQRRAVDAIEVWKVLGRMDDPREALK